MQHIKKIDFSDEKALRSFLLKHPEAIEPCLTIIKDEAYLRGQSRVDILGQAEGRKLVLIELKAGKADADTFVQILEYADFVFRQFRLVFEKNNNLEKPETFDPRNDIRLMVIAPSFHETFLRLAPHSKLEIEPIRYMALEPSNGAKGLTFIQERLPELPRAPIEETWEKDDHLEWITDDVARKTVEQLIMKLEQIEGVTITSTQSYLSVKKDKVYLFATIETFRKHSKVYYKKFSDTGWAWDVFQVRSDKDLTPDVIERLRTSSDNCLP